jgi:hypothetical protein
MPTKPVAQVKLDLTVVLYLLIAVTRQILCVARDHAFTLTTTVASTATKTGDHMFVLAMETFRVKILVVEWDAKVNATKVMVLILMHSKCVVYQVQEILVGPVTTWNIVDSNVVAHTVKSHALGVKVMVKHVVIHAVLIRDSNATLQAHAKIMTGPPVLPHPMEMTL